MGALASVPDPISHRIAGIEKVVRSILRKPSLAPAGSTGRTMWPCSSIQTAIGTLVML